MACFLFLLFLVQYTIAITGLMRPQTAEDFSTILTSVSNNDDDDDVSAAAATPEKKLTAFTSDAAESSGGEPGSLPLVADVSCDSHASESFDNDDHIPYSFNIFRPWSSSGGRFARRQNQNKQFCPQPFVVPLNPTKAQQQQSRPGREPRLSDLLMEMSPVLTDDDEGPCKFIVAHKVAVCAQPSVPPRYSLVDTVDPCRLCKSFFSLLDSHPFLLYLSISGRNEYGKGVKKKKKDSVLIRFCLLFVYRVLRGSLYCGYGGGLVLL